MVDGRGARAPDQGQVKLPAGTGPVGHRGAQRVFRAASIFAIRVRISACLACVIG